MLYCLHPLLLNVLVAKLFAGFEYRSCVFSRRDIHNGRLDLGFNEIIFMSGVGAENLIHLLKSFPPGKNTQIPESKEKTPKKRNVPYLMF